MAIDNLSGRLINELLRHALQWLGNLGRARGARKRQSVEALRQVVIAARETAVYLRQREDRGERDHGVEARLTRLWSELGFRLEDLGLNKLAKRCEVTARLWADPESLDDDFLQQADIRLERIEALARQLLADIGH